MVTDYYRKHSPPGRDVGKAKDCKTAGCKIRLIGIVLVLTLLCVSGLFASGMSPVNPGINGGTVNAAIGHGDLVYHLTSSGLACSHEPVAVFSGGNTIYKTPSLDDKYSIVIPKGGNFAALHVDFIDNDFEVTGGVYSIWEGNDSLYSVTTSGFPFPSDLFGVYKTAYELSSFGISGNNDIPGLGVGRYPASFTVSDMGSPTRSGVTDPDQAAFGFDLWVIDLAEKEGGVSLKDDKVYEIDMTCIPGDFPHADVCQIGVGWGGLLPPPGSNTPSNLYTDPACNNAITQDPGSICSKKWQYGYPGDSANNIPATPKKIYYKRPESYYLTDTIYLRFFVN